MAAGLPARALRACEGPAARRSRQGRHRLFILSGRLGKVLGIPVGGQDFLDNVGDVLRGLDDGERRFARPPSCCSSPACRGAALAVCGDPNAAWRNSSREQAPAKLLGADDDVVRERALRPCRTRA
jgi:hypothetical protein